MNLKSTMMAVWSMFHAITTCHRCGTGCIYDDVSFSEATTPIAWGTRPVPIGFRKSDGSHADSLCPILADPDFLYAALDTTARAAFI
jgi:hypothetical protein